jgi:hypothetical protein
VINAENAILKNSFGVEQGRNRFALIGLTADVSVAPAGVENLALQG